MSFRKKKNLCITLLFLLAFLTIFSPIFSKKKNISKEAMKKDEFIAYHQLVKELIRDNFSRESGEYEKLEEEEKKIINWEEELTYERLAEWIQFLEEIVGNFGSSEEILNKIKEGEKKSQHLEKEEAESCIDTVLKRLDSKNKLQFQSLLVLGDSENITDLEGEEIEQGFIFTNNGKWTMKISCEKEIYQRKIYCLTYNGSIWSIRETSEEGMLKNVWIQEGKGGNLSYFYKNYYVKSKCENTEDIKNQVGDLFFQNGIIKRIDIKAERFTAKAEKITEKEIELKGLGIFPLETEVQYYRLFGPMEAVGRSEIPMEEGMADFVIKNGKIQAVLLIKDKEMERLRVLIKTKDFTDIYHDKIVISSDVDMDLNYDNQIITIPAGEELILDSGSDYFVSNRIYLSPKALTGRIYLPGLERKNGNQGYLGTLEIEKREEGLLLVNEVLLEEYLYAVVPSEMPASYPMEALKAQAITARTYAYKKMRSPSLGEYGANLDDSTSYQVYNNILESDTTTRAVKETKGQLLYSSDDLADTYYYSTSCGYGTDLSVWNDSEDRESSYLQAKEMTIEQKQEGINLQEEDKFTEFIKNKDPKHFECEEEWYRWSYESENMEKLKTNLMDIILKKPGNLIILGKEEEMIRGDFKIQEIQVEERNEGGSIKTLVISTDVGQIYVKNEYYIRSLLADGETFVCLQSGQMQDCNGLLPSAFFVIETQKKKEEVVKFKLFGGGFGHGIGMSQNGAKNLAVLGYDGKQILEFYYEGCEVK